MPSAEYDLRYLQAGLDQLEAYLLASELYWPINASAPAGEPPYPQLTPGGLLLARQRLQATAKSQAEQDELAGLERQLQAMLSKWRTAWGKKAAADFHSRLRLWGDFLDEYRQRPAAQYDRYDYEVSRRVQLNLLRSEAGQLPNAEIEALEGLDKLLRAVFVSGPFAWPTALQPAFPQREYWFLYGGLSKDLKGTE